MQEASSPPSSAGSESSNLSGWPRLPLEILELIMDMLDDDTPTLASILQVDRQGFFAAVPRLYRDPFFRIREIYRRKCHSIRIDAHRTETDQRLRPKTPSDGLGTMAMRKEQETALKVWNAYRTKAFFEQDDAAINLSWREEAQERERRLLMTLMSTLLQDLCVRFPVIAGSFLPPPSPLSAPASASSSSSGTIQGSSCTLDFGPHFREITWTSQHYLRHWTVIDLEKLSTRGRHLPYTFYESFANGDSKDQDGLFNFLFQDRENWMIGVPEYLQRALLNQPGADRIVTLRIPIRRVRSFQDRLDRAPRGWTRTRSIKMWGSSRTSSMRREEERRARDRLKVAKKEEEETRGRSLDVVAISSLLTKASLSPEERKCGRAAGESGHTVDVSSRPYCFTLNKLTNLRRIEICNLSQNYCDWETLRRALFTLEFGGDSGVDLEDLGKMKPTPALQKKRRRPGKIRELCLTTQSTMGPEIDRVLECFGGLEVLEIITPSYQYYPWVTTWDPSLCRELKVLRVGEIGQLTESKVSLEDLGRFWKLEELRLRIDSGQVFQWVVDAKKEARRVSVTGASRSRARGGVVGDGEDALLVNCLPHLKRLGALNRQDLSVDVLTTITEALGDQLEELVICFSGQEGPLQFKHPLTNLTRLAIRFTNLMRFEFESLPQQCPLLEWIIIQHTRFSGSHPDHDVNGDESNPTAMSTERRPYYDILNRKIVDVLGQFTRLRTVYIEGHSTMRGEHLRILVDQCSSLRRIGIHMMPAVTTEELAAIDTELRCRPEKFPLLQRGVYRLPSRMSNYLDRNFHWQVLQWGYDLDE
ncbi:hypothetical protein EC957_007016 [Mortierella hygrophila]|uniref:Uncharacterized protein n=1 Tax=Mortierella hygrophila TaxID=979708 RepID=A0A9P6FDE5_9FUNG|nr:hypothetical protein EC957_007016 [Mortierella hygrophila]